MKGSIDDETLEKAFQSEKNFFDFLDKFKEYYKYITIMQFENPCFEMSFEEYVKEHE